MRNYFGAPIKKLGFGLMRLPTLPGKPDTEIDLEQVNKMVDLYIERGFTYFDTAYVYHGGKSEIAFRECVAKRYPRDKVQVTTKLPLWGPTTLDRMKEITKEQLERAGIDYFDLYFLHGLGPQSVDALKDGVAWNYLQDVKAQGKSKNVGFSYHGDADGLSRLLDARKPGEIDIVQLQINYLDWDSDDVQSKRCYEVCKARDIGVIVMEPVKGGSLANFTPQVADIFKKADPNASLASWALRFPQSLDGVVTVLSGMSNIEHVDDNTKTTANKGALSDAEKAVINAALEELKKVPTIPCTACRYCVDDCPKSINTPGIIGILNEYAKYQNLHGAKRSYGMMTAGGGPFGGAPGGKASDCIECGSCENHCPQHIKIIDTHKKAAQILEAA
jgi:predicted aldo/keto reductase-like oxidoreductase